MMLCEIITCLKSLKLSNQEKENKIKQQCNYNQSHGRYQKPSAETLKSTARNRQSNRFDYVLSWRCCYLFSAQWEWEFVCTKKQRKRGGICTCNADMNENPICSNARERERERAQSPKKDQHVEALNALIQVPHFSYPRLFVKKAWIIFIASVLWLLSCIHWSARERKTLHKSYSRCTFVTHIFLNGLSSSSLKHSTYLISVVLFVNQGLQSLFSLCFSFLISVELTIFYFWVSDLELVQQW
jgi:hypothetical protein